MDNIYYYFSEYYHIKVLEASSLKDTRILNLLNKKFVHTFRVIDNIKTICFYEKIDSKLTCLAEITALFHDIGRFEQIIKYSTFNDQKSIDHAKLSSQLFLSFKKDLLQYITIEDIYTISKAIYHHNKLDYPKNIDNRTLTILKLLKDADKLNILSINLKSNFYKFDGNLIKEEKINDNCIKTLLSQQIISNLDVYTELDNNLKMISWVFDFNYKKTIEIFTNEKILDILTDTENIKNKNIKNNLIDIKRNILKYINKKIKDL